MRSFLISVRSSRRVESFSFSPAFMAAFTSASMRCCGVVLMGGDIMPDVRLLATCLLVLPLLAACRPAAPAADAGRIRVAVSVPPQAYFVERIGGPRVEVEVMIPPGYSHVDYPLTPRQIMALSRARLYVAVG